MSPDNPLLSVVMPVRNAARFLHLAMDSILAQSYDSFEFIVIDDSSSDATAEILKAYRDPRVTLLKNERHRGLVDSLNAGIARARGEYVARMDGDDISHPERLAAELRVLESEANLALVGSYANVIDENGCPVTTFRPPTDSHEIYRILLNRNVFIHSSVMFRKRAVLEVGGYQMLRADSGAAQDYHLWLRLADRYPLRNLPEVLVDYRIHDGQVTMQSLAAQRGCANLARTLAAKRRVDRGEPYTRLSGLRLLERWRAKPGSLGGDLLFLVDLYRRAGKERAALQLAWRGVLTSPLAARGWSLAGWESVRRVLGPKRLKMVRTWLGRGG